MGQTLAVSGRGRKGSSHEAGIVRRVGCGRPTMCQRPFGLCIILYNETSYFSSMQSTNGEDGYTFKPSLQDISLKR